MRIADSFVEELNLEAATTRRVLERVPEAHLGWRPHSKSMSLGQLAMHVATLPSLVPQFVAGDVLDFDSVPKEPPTSTEPCRPSRRVRVEHRAGAFVVDRSQRRARDGHLAACRR